MSHHRRTLSPQSNRFTEMPRYSRGGAGINLSELRRRSDERHNNWNQRNRRRGQQNFRGHVEVIPPRASFYTKDIRNRQQIMVSIENTHRMREYHEERHEEHVSWKRSPSAVRYEISPLRSPIREKNESVRMTSRGSRSRTPISHRSKSRSVSSRRSRHSDRMIADEPKIDYTDEVSDKERKSHKKKKSKRSHEEEDEKEMDLAPKKEKKDRYDNDSTWIPDDVSATTTTTLKYLIEITKQHEKIIEKLEEERKKVFKRYRRTIREMSKNEKTEGEKIDEIRRQVIEIQTNNYNSFMSVQYQLNAVYEQLPQQQQMEKVPGEEAVEMVVEERIVDGGNVSMENIIEEEKKKAVEQEPMKKKEEKPAYISTLRARANGIFGLSP